MGDGRPFHQFTHLQSGEHRFGHLLQQVAAGISILIVFLDQQPVRGRPFDLDQNPVTEKLLTVKSQIKGAAVPGTHRIRLFANAFVGALVPHNHASGAIFASGDHAFEVQVLERMILGADSKALFGRIEGWTSGNGPGSQNVLHFEAEIIV